MAEEATVAVVTGYQTAHHHPTGNTVLILNFGHQPPQAFMIPADLVHEMAKALASSKEQALQRRQ